MADIKENKIVPQNKEDLDIFQSSNPLSARLSNPNLSLAEYSQSIARPKYDKDIVDIIEVVRILNNMAPLKMPDYNFNLTEINGESYYRPDGTLLLIREWDSDVIRDYYATQKNETCIYSVSRILEHEKKSGRLKTKIEPINREGSKIKTNVTIFDLKVNNKYIIIQLSDGGYVNNISEFTGKGKSFQTLFRNIQTFKPARYLEGRDEIEIGFEMIDCIFDSEGKIVRIKKFSNNREVNIDYTPESKNISVKTKNV